MQRIVTGELSPGERLVEEELAERLGYSRGAIRDGAPAPRPRRAWWSASATAARASGASRVEEAVEILEARAALESLAAGYAAGAAPTPTSRELRGSSPRWSALHAAGELLAMSERNAALHRRILEISRHAVALDICARLHSQVVRFQFRTVLAPGRAAQSLAEHRRIVEAIAAGDRKAAEQAMREHLTNIRIRAGDVAEAGAI